MIYVRSWKAEFTLVLLTIVALPELSEYIKINKFNTITLEKFIFYFSRCKILFVKQFTFIERWMESKDFNLEDVASIFIFARFNIKISRFF